MFFSKERSSSVFYSVDGRPEFKIIVPDDYSAHLSMMLIDGNEEPFRFPDPKPSYGELFDIRTAWRPFRLSFLDDGLMFSFTKEKLGLNSTLAPEQLDIDIDNRLNHSIARSYASFRPSPEGMQFFIEIYNSEGEVLEEYVVFVDDTTVTIEAYTGYDDSDHSTVLIPLKNPR